MDVLGFCKQNTIATEEHLMNLKAILLHLNQTMVGGDIVECGAGKSGCCMWLAASHLESGSSQKRDIYLYDIFDMSQNQLETNQIPAKSYYVRLQENQAMPYTESDVPPVPFNQALTNMSQIGYSPERLHYIIGDVNDTLDAVLPEYISILRLDTESYESTKKELMTLFSRVANGGYIIIHYGNRQAVTDFLSLFGEHITVIANEPIPGYVIMVKYPNAENIFNLA
jgi:O-methyltransferase